MGNNIFIIVVTFSRIMRERERERESNLIIFKFLDIKFSDDNRLIFYR